MNFIEKTIAVILSLALFWMLGVAAIQLLNSEKCKLLGYEETLVNLVTLEVSCAMPKETYKKVKLSELTSG